MNFVRGTVTNGTMLFGDQKLDLKPVRKDIAELEGREIVFGFRPESISLAEREDACPLKCRVELTEMLGDNTNIYIISGDQHAILKVDSHDTPEMDTDLSFCIPYENIYLFDGETEKVL